MPRENGRIAFSASTGIASMNPDGSGQWGVELNVGDTAPAWSPDGSQLAVVAHLPGRVGMLVMQPDGSDARLVTTDGQDSDPAWSPDGTRIAFANGANIGVVSPDGGGRTQLTANSVGWASHPTWSPDGKTIAYALWADRIQDGVDVYRSAVSLLDVASGKESTLMPESTASDLSPAWSPDGGTIAFASNGYGSSRIYAVNPDGSGLHALTDGLGWDSGPAWSPDGTQIAFERSQQVWTMVRDGSDARQLTTAGGTAPAWQPLAPGPTGCTLWGTRGDDLLVGTEGRDVICGLGGDDTVVGLGADDTLVGGFGNDYLAGGLGRDRLLGGPGDDRLDARDGGPDAVRGGDGFDTALVDGPRDRRLDVERVKVDRNLALWRPVTADAYAPTNPPILAVDGRPDDSWSSGGFPQHWLEIDLQRRVDVARVRLVAPDMPAGSAFILLGRATAAGTFRLLHVFGGPTADLQRIDFAPRHPWRGIRYVRLVVPQSPYPTPWVSWREVAIYGASPGAKK